MERFQREDQIKSYGAKYEFRQLYTGMPGKGVVEKK